MAIISQPRCWKRKEAEKQEEEEQEERQRKKRKWICGFSYWKHKFDNNQPINGNSNLSNE